MRLEQEYGYFEILAKLVVDLCVGLYLPRGVDMTLLCTSASVNSGVSSEA